MALVHKNGYFASALVHDPSYICTSNSVFIDCVLFQIVSLFSFSFYIDIMRDFQIILLTGLLPPSHRLFTRIMAIKIYKSSYFFFFHFFFLFIKQNYFSLVAPRHNSWFLSGIGSYTHNKNGEPTDKPSFILLLLLSLLLLKAFNVLFDVPQLL